MLKTSLVEETGYAENGEKKWRYNGDVFLLLGKSSFPTSHSKTFSLKPRRYNVFKEKLHRRYSVKKVFFNVSQISQEKACAGVSSYLETFLKSEYNSVVFFVKFCRFFKDTYLEEHLRTAFFGAFSRNLSKTSKEF